MPGCRHSCYLCLPSGQEFLSSAEVAKMPQLHKCVRCALLSLAALLMLLAVPAAAVPAPSHANVVPTSSTVVTSPTVVARAKLSRTGSSSRTLTLVAGLALLLGGAAVGLGEPAARRGRAGLPLP